MFENLEILNTIKNFTSKRVFKMIALSLAISTIILNIDEIKNYTVIIFENLGLKSPFTNEEFILEINTNKKFKETSLLIGNSKCTNIKNSDKIFSCGVLKEGTYKYIFYADDKTFSDEFKKEKDVNTKKLDLDEIVVNRIKYELRDNTVQGEVAFNLFPETRDNSRRIFRINENDVRINNTNNNIIKFSLNEWQNVLRPSEGLFLKIQLNDKFINDIPKVHYFNNNNLSIKNNDTKMILLDARNDDLDNFFIQFKIKNLQRGSILTFGQCHNNTITDCENETIEQTKYKAILKISDMYYVNFTRLRINNEYIYLPSENLFYTSSRISGNNSTDNRNFTVTFERKKGSNNKYTCYINSIQTNNDGANTLMGNFDCTNDFDKIFYIKPENLRRNQEIKISNLITGKSFENDKSILRDMLKNK